ncbi:MAG: YhcH/YjgK/YiaL family protein, partial [Candidatus Margulisiibacteriota bacterium]
IFDSINSLIKYTNIPNIEGIIKFIQNLNLNDIPDGKIEINGEKLFVNISRYFPEDEKEKRFESHNIYTDVQVILKGAEKIQIVSAKNMKKETEYSLEKDCQFFSAQKEISDIILSENEFVVFFPGEAHKPGCFYEKLNDPILKLVFKTTNLID